MTYQALPGEDTLQNVQLLASLTHECGERLKLCFAEDPPDDDGYYTYTFEGKLNELFGISKEDSFDVSETTPYVFTPSLNGHPFVNVETNVSSNNISNITSEFLMKDSTLTQTILCNSISGNIINWENLTMNKLTLDTDIVDYLTIKLSDRYGNDVYGVRRFLAVFVIDFVFVTNDTDNSVSLHEIRKRLKR